MPYHCAYCAAPLTAYGSGYSTYDYGCEACGAAFAPDEAAGLVQARRWLKEEARGVDESLPIDRLKAPA